MSLDTPFQKIGSEKLLSGKIEESIELAIRKKQYLAGQKLPTEGELRSEERRVGERVLVAV